MTPGVTSMADDLADDFADDLDAYRTALAAALADPSLDHWRGAIYASTEHRIADHAALMGVLFRDGWNRYGWPEQAGGLGGGVRHRAVLYDLLSASGLPVPVPYLTLESLAPSVLRFAPSLAEAYLPACLQGDERWAAVLGDPAAVRARQDGETWVLTGTPPPTELATTAKRLVVLATTGDDALTMVMIDVDTPGVSVRPLALASGYNELAEISFDEAVVPPDRVLGEGVEIIAYLRPIERAQHAWLRAGEALRHLRQLRELLVGRELPDGTNRRVGECYSDVIALRATSATTVRRLAAGDTVGAESGIDAALLSNVEMRVQDLARDLLGGEFVLGTAPPMQSWRGQWWSNRFDSAQLQEEGA